VVVHDLNIVRVTVQPSEADPPPFVDPDTVLAGSVTAEPFQPVTRRHAKILERRSGVQHPELPQGRPLNLRTELAGRSSVKKTLGGPISEALDHDG
jgi:hypothetical protein